MTYWTICPKMDVGVINMPDYKKMYLTLFKATEDAINILEAAQLECEERYVSAQEPEITVLPAENEKERE